MQNDRPCSVASSQMLPEAQSYNSLFVTKTAEEEGQRASELLERAGWSVVQ